MRTSTEHTPAYEHCGPPETTWRQAEDEVFNLTPAFKLWVVDEIGEDHFLELIHAACRSACPDIVRARDEVIERWRTADRAYWIARAK